MARLSSILVCAPLTAAITAARLPRDTPSGCTSPALVKTEILTVGDVELQLATFACGTALDLDLGLGLGMSLSLSLPPLFPPWAWPGATPTKTSSAASTPTAAPTANVCGEICSNSCGSIGDLPPTSEDCQAIFNSTTIMNGSISPTFDVASNHVQQLTYGTCRVFFQNLSAKTLTECWTTLSNAAQAAGTQCFPPTQPVNSAGFCTPADGSWQIGIAHS